MKKLSGILSLIFLVSLISPFLGLKSPTQTNSSAQFMPPSTEYWFGTDYLGRDVFSRTLHGGTRTLITTVVGTSIAMFVGVLLGLISASRYRFISVILQMLTQGMLAFPSVLLALIILAIAGRGWFAIALATGIAQIAPIALVIQTNAQVIRYREYVQASRALGGTEWHQLVWHIFPNLYPILLSYMGMTFVYVLLSGQGFSFLGLVDNPSLPEWGVMLADGRYGFRQAPWVALAPACMLMLVVFCINRLTDSKP
jgi:peptide/nickel transport system permease protein